MADLEIRISAKDMGADAGLKNLQQAAQKAEGSLDGLGDSASKMSKKVSDGGRSSDDAAGGLDRVGESADNTEGKFTGLASGIDGVTSLMDDPSPQEFAQGLADIADGVGNFLIPTLKMMSVELIKNAANMAKSAASSVASAATTAASWVAAGASMVASMVASAASAAVNFAVMVAGWVAAGAAAVANAALVVASYIAMAVQAAISAAAMAVAWVIAMGPIILAIAAVIAIIYILIRNWDTVRDVAVAAMNVIWQAIQSVFDWIVANWPLILAVLTGPIGLAVLAIVKHWDTIKAAAAFVFMWIGEFVRDIADKIWAYIRAAVDMMVGHFNFFKDIAVGAFQAIVNFVTGMPGKIASAASNMWDSISNGFKAMINLVIGWWNRISFTVPKIDIPSVSVPGLGKVGGGSIGGQTVRVPQIPKLQAGGTRSGLVAVGERGMELVDLGAGGSVIGANRSAAMMNAAGPGGGQTIINLHVLGSIRSDRELVKMFKDAIARGELGPGFGTVAG